MCARCGLVWGSVSVAGVTGFPIKLNQRLDQCESSVYRNEQPLGPQSMPTNNLSLTVGPGSEEEEGGGRGLAWGEGGREQEDKVSSRGEKTSNMDSGEDGGVVGGMKDRN